MSMIGYTLLNEILNDPKIILPADVLNELRNGVIKSLKQKGAVGENKDGMDIALCLIQDSKLYFSGAYNLGKQARFSSRKYKTTNFFTEPFFSVSPKTLRRFSAAQPINYNSPSDPGIKFHCKHPCSCSTPSLDNEEALQDL